MFGSLLSSLKRLDAYPKTLEDFSIKTFSGGTITLFSALIMVLLFASEIRDYVRPGKCSSVPSLISICVTACNLPQLLNTQINVLF